MHIKEVVIDGFKSYAVRTKIGPFDEQFNAITGKNGSGKSNILDALCFVLGITQLSKVRVHNLAELVYKQGQTGVTRALVSVVLDNRNKARSPVNYEDVNEIVVEREVVIGGRNKYRINGKNVSQQQVASLFHSVQLNVNNPHFLIMQGTITRVINMKPPEVVGLLEEAAGTKMYENRKMDALKLLEKKRTTIKEIDQVIANDYEPSMEKLRREKAAFTSWNELNTQALRLERFCTAVEYFKLREAAEEGKQSELEATIEKIHDEKMKLLEEMKKAEYRLSFLKDKNALSAEVSAGRKKVKEANEAVTGAELERAGVERNQAQITRKISEQSSALTKLKAELQQCNEAIESLEEDIAKRRQRAEALSAAVQNMQERPGAQEDPQLRIDLDELMGEAKKHKDKRDELKRLAEKLRREVERGESADREARELNQKNKAKLLDIEAQIADHTARIADIGYDFSMHNSLRAREAELLNEKKRAEEEVADLVARVEKKLTFSYRENHDIVRPSSVAGMVGALCHVEPENYKWLPALDVVMGKKIFNVVVDNKRTATTLIERNMLHQQTTILPADNLHYMTISDAEYAKAKKIAQARGGEVHRAIDLVVFHESLRSVFESIFGNVFLCENQALATEVCRVVKVRCITIKGDQLDPNGTATGGSLRRYDVSLEGASRLKKAKDELKGVLLKLQENSGRLAAFSREASRYNSLKEAHEGLIRQRTYLQNHITDEVSAADDQLEQNRTQLASHNKKIAELEMRMKIVDEGIAAKNADLANSAVMRTEAQRLKKIADMNVELATARKEAEAAEKKLKDEQSKLVNLEERVNRKKDELNGAETELRELNSKMQEIDEVLLKLRSELDEVRKIQEGREREELDKNNEMEKLSLQIDKFKHAKSDLDGKLETLIAKLEAVKRDAAAAKVQSTKILKENPWLHNSAILSDLASVARSNDAGNPGQVLLCVQEKDLAKRREEMEAAKERVAEMGSRINKKAVVLCEKGEAELAAMKTKREALETEKAAIEEIISDLDESKGKALSNTWQLVNEYLGTIFRALLPNVNAKLEPPAGMTAQEGLELKVAFGDKWKDSLSELSGGQKSLLALSLILALLKYKPAPFYILDEVDAALDISHTKNIGHMIKTVFPDSQFIIVSLKEGMFQNANVLFSTRFQDNTSMVSRSVSAGGNTGEGSMENIDAQSRNTKRPRVDQQ